MQFNSLIFLFLFLPIALGVFFLTPGKIKNIVLLIFSLFFYTWGDKIFVLVLLYSTIANYNCGLLIEDGHKKAGLTLSLLVNLLLLVFFKYYQFTFGAFYELISFFHVDMPGIESIPVFAAPIGISFYTFKTISYSIDVYKSKVKASRNIIDFATYVTMFPPLVAGPIIRYADIEQQLKRKNLSIANFSAGIERFIIGLTKKMLIANSFAPFTDKIFSTEVSDLSTPMAWAGIIAYSVQIYFDFSGYSDMAIGLGKMFGFDFPENFNYPYISRNIREFWRRWHISLSGWLRDYLFLPLAFSLSRRLKKEHYLSFRADHFIYLTAIFITFLVCGIWHGAALNFIAWGVWYGVIIAIEHLGFGRILKRAWIPLQHGYTLMVVMLGWVIFRTDNLTHAFGYIFILFSFTPGDDSINSYLSFYFVNREFFAILIAAVLFSAPFYNYLQKRILNLLPGNIYFSAAANSLGIAVLVALFIVSVSYIASGTYNAFIYAQF
jgi:alginate O-acetyltransferase complex protein AlgI